MTGDQLKHIKQRIGYGTCDMYRTLGLPRRTYQDYEAGKRRVPDDVAARALTTYRNDRRWQRQMLRRIGNMIDAAGGVPLITSSEGDTDDT